MSMAGEPRRTVLYRCPTPTNRLCPCGAVERRLRKLGIEHDTVRLPQRRSARPEIEELTRQRRLPVLVDGSEVVHDSRRIVQYLDWMYGGDDLYNLENDGHSQHSDQAHGQGGGEDQGVHRQSR